MKVAIFHSTLPQPGRKPGGVEVAVHRLANALVEHEKLAATVLSCSPRPSDAQYDHLLIPNYRQLGGKLGRLTLLPLALNLLDFQRFDILHLHGDDWFFVNRRIPTVRTMHGSAREEARFAGTFKYRALELTLYPLEHLAAALATCTLAVGPEARETYQADYLADNGVDLMRFTPRPKSFEPLLFYIGTWRGRKRGEFAFDTFIRHVLPAVPNARLYMASDYAPQHRSVIQDRFPDEVELAAWLAKSWVFMYPSLYEGFGIPYIEALASGTAVVTTRNSGAEYVLDHGRFGVLCDDSNFGPCVVSMLKDHQRRTAFQIEGRAHAANYSWPVVAARHAEIYRSVLSLNSKRRLAA
jgi:glycosyltransferase involved in cell wall biosynthesis